MEETSRIEHELVTTGRLTDVHTWLGAPLGVEAVERGSRKIYEAPYLTEMDVLVVQSILVIICVMRSQGNPKSESRAPTFTIFLFWC